MTGVYAKYAVHEGICSGNQEIIYETVLGTSVKLQ